MQSLVPRSSTSKFQLYHSIGRGQEQTDNLGERRVETSTLNVGCGPQRQLLIIRSLGERGSRLHLTKVRSPTRQKTTGKESPCMGLCRVEPRVDRGVPEHDNEEISRDSDVGQCQKRIVKPVD